jgi:hypothetical protein
MAAFPDECYNQGMVAALSNAGILQRMLTSVGDELSPDVARFFLGLSIAEPDIQRIEALSEKANEGELSASERDELSTYVFLNDFLGIMQSRARLAIKKQSPAG